VRVLVAEPIAEEGIARLREEHDVDERPGLSRDELCAILPEYDALIVRSQVQVDAGIVAAGTRLQVIGRAGVGVDNVDLEAATRAGITVVNAPTGNTIAAAEHTLALLYGVARKIAAADASVRRGEWKRAQFTGLELRGRTLGIVGLGKIGQAIAARARAMEMTVLAADPFVTPEQAQHHGVELVSFDDLLARSDVVSVHVPLTRSTRGLNTRYSCGSTSSWRDGWPSSSRIASRPCAWPTGFSFWRTGAWPRPARTRTSSPRADATPSSSSCRPQAIGEVSSR